MIYEAFFGNKKLFLEIKNLITSKKGQGCTRWSPLGKRANAKLDQSRDCITHLKYFNAVTIKNQCGDQ